ncbi:DNA-binding protein [Paraburkholderia fungorum]|uniref:DNA-binding protein n=1 Tax=Paraburkholderia fungorum TaxID=134537 RepID=UPI00402B9083
METVKHDGIFKSAHEAVIFACNYAAQQYAMSPMAKLLQRGGSGSGRGLIGLDGAAQSGMVLAELQRIDYVQMLVLVARCAPRKERCECKHACCGGWKPNPLYRDAVSQLTELVIPALGGAFSLRRFRASVIEKFFGEKIKIKEIAGDLNIPPRTAERHASIINAYLKDVEKSAWTEWYGHLDEAGMIVSQNA